MDRQSRKFKCIAAVISIPLLSLFLFVYSFFIFQYNESLNEATYYALLVLGLVGAIMWAKISFDLIKELRS